MVVVMEIVPKGKNERHEMPEKKLFVLKKTNDELKTWHQNVTVIFTHNRCPY